MNNDRMQKIEALFQEAYELPIDQRDAFIRHTCGGDDDLAEDLRALLSHSDRAATEFLEGSPRSDDASDLPAPSAHTFDNSGDTELGSFGRYRILRKIGTGGMGIVYEAEQDNPKRRVALKILRLGTHHDGTLRRFEREAQLLAQLQHPAITHIYDAGIIETNLGDTPFIAMEFVDGESIKTWARENHPTVEERLNVIAQIADGVHHASQSGIVHRDLKPGNILITKDGNPKILDFGIARVTQTETQTQTLQTEMGQLLGTVSYMSPEQVSGDSSNVDVTSDVYALGVLLFEILSDRLPLDLQGRSIAEAIALIQDKEPTHLSSIDARFRGDIDTIVLKAIEKDPRRRYPTAAAFAGDIRRHLSNEPIRARPATTLYQLGKFARRNRSLVTVIGLAFVGLLAATIATTNYAISEARMRRIADRESLRSAREAYRSGLLAAQAAIRTHDFINARHILESMPASNRGNWEWQHLNHRLNNSEHVLAGHHNSVNTIQFSLDGTRLLSAADDGTIGIWDIASNRRVMTITTGERAIRHALFFDKGRKIISVGSANKICIWNAESGKLEQTVSVKRGDRCENDGCAILSMAISDDRRQLAATSNDATIRVWDLNTGQNTLTVPLEREDCGHAIAFGGTAIDRNLIAGWFNGLLRVPLSMKESTNRRVKIDFFTAGNDRVPSSIAHCNSANLIATGCADKSIVLWDAATLAVRRKLIGHTAGVKDVALSSDGTTLASCGEDQSIRIWNTRNGRMTQIFAGHNATINAVAFSPNGDWLASAGQDHSIRLWRLNPTDPSSGKPINESRNDYVPVFQGHKKHAYRVIYSGASEATSLGWSGDILRWNTQTFEIIQRHNADFTPLRCIDVSSDRQRYAVGHGELWIALIDATNGNVIRKFERPNGNVTSVAFSPDETLIAATQTIGFGAEGLDIATVWDIDSARVVRSFEQPACYRTIARPSGLIVASFDEEGSQFLDARTGQRLFAFAGVNARVESLTFSKDDQRFLLGLRDGSISVHDSTTGSQLGVLIDHTERVFDAEFSPNGERIASCSNDNTIRIWDAEFFAPLLELRGHSHYVHDVAFSPDGDTLLSASGDSTIGVWRTHGPK